MRWLFAALCLSFAVTCQAAVVVTINGKPVDKNAVIKPVHTAQPTRGSKPVEKILVLKSARQLQLISDGKPIKTYRISLGKQPKGPKTREDWVSAVHAEDLAAVRQRLADQFAHVRMQRIHDLIAASRAQSRVHLHHHILIVVSLRVILVDY